MASPRPYGAGFRMRKAPPLVACHQPSAPVRAVPRPTCRASFRMLARVIGTPSPGT